MKTHKPALTGSPEFSRRILRRFIRQQHRFAAFSNRFAQRFDSRRESNPLLTVFSGTTSRPGKLPIPKDRGYLDHRRIPLAFGQPAGVFGILKSAKSHHTTTRKSENIIFWWTLSHTSSRTCVATNVASMSGHFYGCDGADWPLICTLCFP